jgi:hypothetical protein
LISNYSNLPLFQSKYIDLTGASIHLSAAKTFKDAFEKARDSNIAIKKAKDAGASDTDAAKAGDTSVAIVVEALENLAVSKASDAGEDKKEEKTEESAEKKEEPAVEVPAEDKDKGSA